MKQLNFYRWPILLAVALGSTVVPWAKGQDTNATTDAPVLTLDAAIRLAQTDNPEIRVLAALVIGGLASATLLALFVLPVVCKTFERGPRKITGGRLPEPPATTEL